jgi:hypothetical protein
MQLHDAVCRLMYRGLQLSLYISEAPGLGPSRPTWRVPGDDCGDRETPKSMPLPLSREASEVPRSMPGSTLYMGSEGTWSERFHVGRDLSEFFIAL